MSPETVAVVVGSAVLNALAAFMLHGVRSDVKHLRELWESEVSALHRRLKTIEDWREEHFVKGAGA